MLTDRKSRKVGGIDLIAVVATDGDGQRNWWVSALKGSDDMDRMKLAIESLKTHIDYDNKANGMQTRTITIGIAEAEEILELLKEDCHNCKLKCLLQKYDELKEKYDALLKEQEAKTGHWIQSNPKYVSAKATGGSRMSTCSNCGKWGRKSFSFCPHCGAKMEGR